MQIGNVSIHTYGNYSGENYGAHCMRVGIGSLSFWFSYDTVVAFSAPGKGMVVSENCWRSTTGKHLNAIDGGNKEGRLPRVKFEESLAETPKEHNLVSQ